MISTADKPALQRPSADLKRQCALPGLPPESLRRFGLHRPMLGALSASAHVLDIDFLDSRRPRLVTDILRFCTKDTSAAEIDEEFFWSLTVGTRTACLLEIAALEGFTLPTCVTRCVGETCRELVEIELPLGEIVELHRQHGAPQSVAVGWGTGQVQVRVPTGADQCWISECADNLSPDLLLTQLLPSSLDPPDDRACFRVEEALVTADPLIDFQVRATCPECGLEQEYPVDLQQLALSLLADRQRALLDAVHRLAVGYHWSERDILALPDSRRNHYLRALELETS